MTGSTTPEYHAAWTHRPTGEWATVCASKSNMLAEDLADVTCQECLGLLLQMGMLARPPAREKIWF